MLAMFRPAPLRLSRFVLQPRCTSKPLSTAAASSPLLRRVLRRPSEPQFFTRNYSKKKARAKQPPPEPIRQDPTSLTPEQPRLLDQLKTAGQLSDAAAPPDLSTFQRLWPSTLFAGLVTGGAIYYGYTWRPTPSSERLFPEFPRSFATVAGLMIANAAVFVAWRIPLPILWRTLNRYFIQVPAIPHAPAVLGAGFSHQTLGHIAANMFVLYIFGTSLCEQIGPGWFLSLYFSGAAMSGLASLTYYVLRSKLNIMTLGASGANAAILTAYAYLNPNNEIYIIFLPFMAIKAKFAIAWAAGLDVLGLVRGWQMLDHMGHLGGYAWGLLYARYLEQEAQRRRRLADSRRR